MLVSSPAQPSVFMQRFPEFQREAFRDMPVSSGSQTPPKKHPWSDRLAITAMGLFLLSNTLLLVSPFISKQARRIPDTFQLNSLLRGIADHKAFSKKLWQLSSLAGLLMLTSNYQTSINTQQPSKLLATGIFAVGYLGHFLKPNALFQICPFLGSVFWFAGERNDIVNSNHPQYRREWDLKRLFQKPAASKETVDARVASVIGFMGTDLKRTFSFEPWREWAKRFFKKSDWTIPQAYQTALGAQLNLISSLGILALLAMNQRTTAAMKISLNTILKISAALGSIMTFLPLAARANQNRQEIDGAMTLAGIPLCIAARTVLASPFLNHWKGIGALGSGFVTEGKRQNSKKYRAFVDYVKTLHGQALVQPNLTAQDVLRNLALNPQEEARLKRSMGQTRVDFLKNLLLAAPQNQKARHLTLAQYLTPFIQSYTNEI